jgi:cytochrome P450
MIERPPGPDRRWFGFPLLRGMRRDYLGFVQDLRRKHGDVVYMHIGAEHLYDVFSPELIREVLVDQTRSLIRWERATEVFAQAHGQSVLVTEGEVWQRQRRMLQPGFGPKRIADYAPLMVAAGEKALDSLASQGDREVEFEHAMTLLAMDVILRTLFSSEATQDAAAAGEAVRVLTHAAMREMFWPVSLPLWLPLPGNARKRWALRTLDALVWRHIRTRQAQGGDHHDLLAMLMAAQDESEPGSRLSEQELRDQCMTIFQAGHETTATALTWWGWAMASHPQVAQRAHEEVDRVLGSRTPAFADLPALSFLGNTIKETLRLYTPAPALMSRRAMQDMRVGRWQVPKGSLVRITPWVVHHDPRWYPDPERFDPDRFDEARAASLPRGAFLPFGTGPRVCIGNSFSMAEMTLIAAMLLQRFELRLPPGAKTPKAAVNVTLRPAEGLRLVLSRRAASPAMAKARSDHARCPHAHAP